MTEIVIHELAYYTALAAQNHRGLVAMEFRQHAMPYVIGDIAGFLPADARAMHGQGQAVPYFSPDAERPADLPVRRTEAPRQDAIEIARLDAIEVSPTIFAESKLTRIALAKKLLNLPQNTGGIQTDRADEVIRKELIRRGSPATDETGGALTSNNGTGPLDPAANPPGGIVPAIPPGQPPATE